MALVRLVLEYNIPDSHIEDFLEDPVNYTAEYDWFPWIVQAYEIGVE